MTDININIRASSLERDKWKAVARSSGVTLSGLIRGYLNSMDIPEGCRVVQDAQEGTPDSAGRAQMVEMAQEPPNTFEPVLEEMEEADEEPPPIPTNHHLSAHQSPPSKGGLCSRCLRIGMPVCQECKR
jgi:hypothetical protein